MKDLWVLRKHWSHDTVLMDAIYDEKTLTECQWAEVNYVHLWTRTIRAADILDPIDRYIAPWERKGSKRLLSYLDCPQQELPSTTAFTLSKNAYALPSGFFYRQI